MLVPGERERDLDRIGAGELSEHEGSITPTAYLASLDDPVPDTPDRSMIRMTDGGCGGRVLWYRHHSLETCA